MNTFKKNGGFTLVELIVVIAILAVLAGIAVPAYSGYLQSAEKAGDITALSAVKTAAVAAMATEGGVDNIRVEVADNKITAVTVNIESVTPASEGDEATEDGVVLYSTAAEADSEAAKAFAQYIEVAECELTYFETGAQWSGDEWAVYPTPTEGE